MGKGNPEQHLQEGLRHVHPDFQRLLYDYHRLFMGKVNIQIILERANKTMGDLPLLQGYVDGAGRSMLCWNYVLGVCTYGKKSCRFRKEHVNSNKITPEFVKATWAVIGPGVLDVVKRPESVVS